MIEYITENKEWLVGAIATLSAWFGGRKMKKTNEFSADLENLKTLREIERELVDEAQRNVTELRDTIKQLKKIIENQDVFLSRYRKLYGGLKDE